MTSSTPAKRTRNRLDEKSEPLLSIARQIIRDTGSLDLPMRQLAAQAQVSLQTPYKLFGSQDGIIRAILRNDQAVCYERMADLRSTDPLDSLFDQIELVVGFYSDNQTFYRALFRSGHSHSGYDEGERAGEDLLSFFGLCERALDEGHIEPRIDPRLLSEVLADNFLGNLRNWALGPSSIDLAALKIKLGFALVLASVTLGPRTPQMRAKIRDYQDAIHGF